MSDTHEYFWSLVLESEGIIAAVWSRSGEETRVVAVGQAISWGDESELVTSTDAALSSAIEDLPEDTPEPVKTIFGVAPSWVLEGQIKREHLVLIKEITEKLSLTPIGFVVLPEAIANEIKHSEGSPLTGVIIGITKNTLDITLFKLGNLLGTVSVGRSVSIFEDVIEGLSRFNLNGEVIPSRFILYGGHDGEVTEVKDTLTMSDWKDQSHELVFLHIPQITIADREKKAISLSLAGSTEMGEVKSLFVPEKAKNGEVSYSEEPYTNDVPVPTAETPEALTDLGFVSEEDIANVRPLATDEVEEVAPHVVRRPLSSVFAPVMAFATKFKSIKLPKGSKHGIPTPVKLQSKKNMPLILGLSSLGVLAFLVFAWWYFPKAEIIVYVAPQVVSGRADLTLDREVTSIDTENNVIPAHELSTTLTSSKTKSATGSITTGDKARGTITIQNGTSVPVKFAAGTFVVTSSDLRFALDDSASVASALSPTSPGSVSVPVTAEKIGSEYNIASGETFKVSNYPKSEVDAVVDSSGITGGTSRQVVAVSKSDIDSLTSELAGEMESEISGKLTEQVPDGNSFIPDSLSTKVTSSSPSAKAGDQTDSVSLSLTMEATGFSISREDLTSLAVKTLTPSVPSGFTLRPEQVDAKFTVSDVSTNPVSAELTLTARVLPNTDPDEITRKVLGFRPEKIDSSLQSIPGFVKASVTTTPKLPSFIRIIPLRKRNVSIEVVAER